MDDAILAALGHGGLGICVCDERDAIRYVNPFFRDRLLAGMEEAPTTFAEAVRATIASGRGTFLDSTPLDAFVARIAHRRRTMTGSYSFSTDLHDGSWLLVTDTNTKLDDGWLVAVAQDITGLKREEQRLREDHEATVQEARTDFLTGVANRRHGIALAERLHAEAAETGGGLCVAFIDLDRFKQINDRHGHEVGDRALVAFAAHCQARAGADDVFCRSGGEEFLFAAREADPQQALLRIRRLIADLPALALDDGTRVACTASVGVAVLHAHESWPELLRRADKALYRAKAAGRNRVELAY